MSLDMKEETAGGQTIVRFSGEFEGIAAQGYRDPLFAIADKAKGTLMLDFGGVEYVDSSGIGVLLELAKHAEKKRVKLAVMNPREEVKRVFDVTRVDRVFAVIG